MSNQFFCNQLAFTYNDYRWNHIAGTNRAGLWGWVEATKSGDCASLLTYYSALVRTS
jgi:hypothetical protein